MRYMMGELPGMLKPKPFGQLGDGGNILSSRGDGWDLRDTEGWRRFPHCRPATIQDVVTPKRGKGFIGYPGDLDRTRHTLAFTSDGRRFHR